MQPFVNINEFVMKNILLTILTLVFSPLISAQVLYSENFNNYTIGNLGTDPNGAIPGQGGWLTLCGYTKSNSFFSIVNETNRGKVLDLTTNYTKNTEAFGLIKPNIDKLIDTRTPGNDVIKFEIDFFTGNKMAIEGLSRIRLNWESIHPYAVDSCILQLLFWKQTGRIEGQTIINQGTRNIITDGSNGVYLPFVTWITFVVYLDYPNNKIYIEVPYLNKVFSGVLAVNNANNLIQDYKPIAITMATSFMTNMNYSVYSNHRYDNIKITALKAVPPHVLSTENFLAEKFNVFPNPATNVVNITNAENMLINQVTVYDIAGKEIKKQTYTNETNIQLNIENLSSGTYMLHLQTNEGTAVKKLVKK